MKPRYRARCHRAGGAKAFRQWHRAWPNRASTSVSRVVVPLARPAAMAVGSRSSATTPRARGGKDRRGIAARPERAVDVEPAGSDRESRNGLRSEHGMVSNRSASGEVIPRAAIRHQSRAPGGCGVANDAACPGTELLSVIAHSASGLFQMRAKPARLPDLKLVPFPHEGRLDRDRGLGLHSLGQADTTFPVDLQDFALPVERGRVKRPVLPSRAIAAPAIASIFRQEGVAAAVQGFRVKRGVDVQPFEAVPRQHRPERSRDRKRDPWHPKRLVKCETKRSKSPPVPGEGRSTRVSWRKTRASSPDGRLRFSPRTQTLNGMTWDSMGTPWASMSGSARKLWSQAAIGPP